MDKLVHTTGVSERDRSVQWGTVKFKDFFTIKELRMIRSLVKLSGLVHVCDQNGDSVKLFY